MSADCRRQIRLWSLGPSTIRAAATTTAAAMMKITASTGVPRTASPSAVPAAGACSVFVTLINKTTSPRERAPDRSTNHKASETVPGSARPMPTIMYAATTAERCPPMIRDGDDATECGTKNTIATDEAIAATMAPLETTSCANSTTHSNNDASTDWPTYDRHLCVNRGSIHLNTRACRAACARVRRGATRLFLPERRSSADWLEPGMLDWFLREIRNCLDAQSALAHYDGRTARRKLSARCKSHLTVTPSFAVKFTYQ